MRCCVGGGKLLFELLASMSASNFSTAVRMSSLRFLSSSRAAWSARLRRLRGTRSGRALCGERGVWSYGCGLRAWGLADGEV